MSTSPLTGISSSTLFQDGINDVTQNNLIINPAFASSDETGDDNNGAGDEQQLPANTASTTAPNTLINELDPTKITRVM